MQQVSNKPKSCGSKCLAAIVRVHKINLKEVYPIKIVLHVSFIN